MDWSLANRLLPQSSHVHIEDGFGPDEAQRQLRRRVLWRRAILNDGQTKICVPSRRLETIAVDIWRLPQNRVFYIPNGIDCTRFAPRPTPQNSNEVVIGTVASLRPEKNIARLLELFCRAQARDPSARMKLIVVGDGSERRALQECASRTLYADRIEFAGATSKPEAFLARMDIFALSSDTEQMPLSVLEAMATGLPVVSFKVGDLPFMVAPENVPMVSIPLTQSELYTETLLRFVRDPELRTHIGRANREAAASRFDERIMAKAYERLFG